LTEKRPTPYFLKSRVQFLDVHMFSVARVEIIKPEKYNARSPHFIVECVAGKFCLFGTGRYFSSRLYMDSIETTDHVFDLPSKTRSTIEDSYSWSEIT
jgi:hypothetical protein